MLEHQQHLVETSDPRRSGRVTDIALDRTNSAVLSSCCEIPKALAQGFQFYGVTQLRSCAMRFDIAYASGLMEQPLIQRFCKAVCDCTLGAVTPLVLPS